MGKRRPLSNDGTIEDLVRVLVPGPPWIPPRSSSAGTARVAVSTTCCRQPGACNFGPLATDFGHPATSSEVPHDRHGPSPIPARLPGTGHRPGRQPDPAVAQIGYRASRPQPTHRLHQLREPDRPVGTLRRRPGLSRLRAAPGRTARHRRPGHAGRGHALLDHGGRGHGLRLQVPARLQRRHRLHHHHRGASRPSPPRLPGPGRATTPGGRKPPSTASAWPGAS